jgi:hypothetical protein
MYDRQTKSLWSQMTGEPVVGPLVGDDLKLRVLPIVTVSWAEWRRLHPDTKVLNIRTGYDRPYRVGAWYGEYFGSSDLMFPVWKQDRRLPRKARIFGLEIDGQVRAYPLETLRQASGMVNDVLADQPVVIVHHDALGYFPLPQPWRDALADLGGDAATITDANELTLKAARAVLKKQPDLIRLMSAEFLLAMPVEARLSLLSERTPDSRRKARTRPGQFSPEFRDAVAQRGLIAHTRAYERGSHSFVSSDDPRQLFDEQGRTWRIEEDALVAPDGKRLERLGGHLAYWFAWYAFHPDGEVYIGAASRTSP